MKKKKFFIFFHLSNNYQWLSLLRCYYLDELLTDIWVWNLLLNLFCYYFLGVIIDCLGINETELQTYFKMYIIDVIVEFEKVLKIILYNLWIDILQLGGRLTITFLDC